MWMYRVGAGGVGFVTDGVYRDNTHGYHVKDDHRITLVAVSIIDCVINVWLRTANKFQSETLDLTLNMT